MDELFAVTKVLVEGAIKRFGVDAEGVRAKDEGGPRGPERVETASWTLTRGSAFVLVSVVKRPEQKAVFLRIVSPIMTLPDPDRHLALFHRLLELNANGLVNASFGLLAERVVVVSERPAAGLDANEVEQVIKHTSAVADTYDDRLVAEFGGKRASDRS